jgi:erythromycin esterase
MGNFQGTRDLIEWMRAYNRNPAHERKIRFYGMDVVGATGTWVPAAEQVVAYLQRVEPVYAEQARKRLVPALEKFARPNFTAANDAFAALPADERNAIAATVVEVADRFDLLGVSYLAASSREDYEWARQIALGLRYGITLVTNYEAKSRENPVWNARDFAMAENVRWIRAREGAKGGVVVLAHNAHIQTAMSTEVAPNMSSLGVFLAAMVGSDYRTVGFTFNRGAMPTEGGKEIALDPAPVGTIDAAMARRPLYFLDLGELTPGSAAHRWVNRPVKQRIQSMATSYHQLRSWNALIFVDSVSSSWTSSVR